MHPAWHPARPARDRRVRPRSSQRQYIREQSPPDGRGCEQGPAAESPDSGRLAEPPLDPGSGNLPEPTSEQQGVADYIQPGDYISVIATVSSAGKVAAKTIFTQLHVIKVGMQGTTGSSSATSLTVVVTQCQAEIITWFLAYAALKYSLESYRDYQPGEQAPDPNCQSVEDAHGVTLQFIQTSYPTLFK
ncbi:MAG: hypothetical protein E6I41_05925 [Chloroflexi bacterium]|nr:MAG: hypothetical protein E6I41_05925 [Chloroflexota bacterium]